MSRSCLRLELRLDPTPQSSEADELVGSKRSSARLKRIMTAANSLKQSIGKYQVVPRFLTMILQAFLTLESERHGTHC